MSKCWVCNSDKKYNLEFQYDRLVNGMFKYSYEMNHDGKYVIPNDSLHTIIDTYITEDMGENNIKSLVDEYGVFEAIKLYQDDLGDFNIDELSFMRTYGTLVYRIIDTYIHENDIVCEEEATDESCEVDNDGFDIIWCATCGEVRTYDKDDCEKCEKENPQA